MYVIIRTMKIEKGYLDSFKERFMKPSPLHKSPGFVKREMYAQTKNSDFDILKVMIFFEDKKAYYAWEGSPDHIAMHKDKNHENHTQPEGLIEASREAFTLVAEQPHE
ncbi:MAG: antibiotic biosynthesis monooxygenase, partial [Acholeplasma sp.]|nr:antibiotic biosynthesis monooxygenase [Acholeplasma sp.]